ncbi:MAG: excisionase family DNA binding domain-containing protein, partial [candidate division WWE3 bacterium CSP1-7]
MNNALPESSLYSITEASRILGVSPTTLRRWEDEGRLTPARTPGGDRRFSPEDIQNILQSFRKETDQRLNTEVETLPPLPLNPDPVTPPPPPLIPIRQIENYRPRRPRPYFHFALALTFLLTGYIFFSSIPLLTKMRLERAFSPGPANPIVDVNDALEYKITETGELRLGLKFPVDIGVLFAKSLNVAEDAILNTARFLGTVFFGNGDDYFISPTGDASFNSVNSGAISVTSLNVENLTVTGTTTGVTGTGGGGGLATGGDADTLEGQPGSYYLDLGNEIGTCANCLTTAEIDESTLSISAANADTIDFLDSL